MTHRIRHTAYLGAALLALGCGVAQAQPSSKPATVGQLAVTSIAMPDGSTVGPAQLFQVCGGRDQSPDLQWQGAPRGTRSYAIVMSDPDAPGGTVWHWVAYDIAPTTTSLPQGLPHSSPLAKQAVGVSAAGYSGPCAPPGPPHSYHVNVYALDVPILGLPDGAPNATVRAALPAHTLASGGLTAHYALFSS